MLNTHAENEHISKVERFIRTIKDSTRSTYRMLFFNMVPKLIVIRLAQNVVFWLKAFPMLDSISSKYSPRSLIIGFEVTYSKHIVIKFGTYAQTHEDHSNNMS